MPSWVSGWPAAVMLTKLRFEIYDSVLLWLSGVSAMERRATAGKRERVSQTVRRSGWALGCVKEAGAWADQLDRRLRVKDAGSEGRSLQSWLMLNRYGECA